MSLKPSFRLTLVPVSNRVLHNNEFDVNATQNSLKLYFVLRSAPKTQKVCKIPHRAYYYKKSKILFVMAL